MNTTLEHTLSQTTIPHIYSSKGPVVLPKNHVLSPKRPTSLSPFPIMIAFKPEFWATSLSYSFLLVISHVYSPIMVFFLLLCLLL